MKVHITGANGFVGRHLLETAREAGLDPVALVRQPSAFAPSQSVRLIKDIERAQDWSEAVGGADAIVHLAARVHVMRESPREASERYDAVNRAATAALARAAAERGVRRFVFMSSIKVNGEATTSSPFSSDSVPAPVDPYGISKLAAEDALWQISAETGMEIVIIRPPVVYGAGVGGNIRRIARAVQRGMPLPFGAIHNRRTMVAVENLSAAIVSGLQLDVVPSRAVLVGDPRPVATPELVRLLADGLGRQARLMSVSPRLLRLAASAGGRAQDADRLMQDLVVTPDWVSLGVAVDELVDPAEALPALGASMRREAD